MNEHVQSTAGIIASLEKRLAAMEAEKVRLVGENISLRQLYEQAPLGYQSLDENGSFLSVNQAWTDTLGYHQEEVIGRNFSEFLHPDWQDHFRENFPRFKSLGEILGVEFEMVRKDGSLALVSFHGKIGKNPKGNFERTHCIFRDITESRRMEEKYKHFFDLVPDMMCIVSTGGYLRKINSAWQSVLAYSEGELLSVPLIHFVHPGDQEATLAEILRLIEGEHTSHFTNRYRHKDGSYRWFEWRATPANNNGLIFAVARDVSERKRAEEVLLQQSETALLLSEQEFRTLAEAMPQIVWATRPDGSNIYFNQQWVDYTGLTMEESYGNGWNTPFHPDDKQRAWDAWQRATQHDEKYSLECRLKRADGVYRWWLIRGEPMRGENGEILKWFGTCTDIEELKRSEAMLHEANTLLEQRVNERTRDLQESEEQFRVLIQNLQSAVALVNEHGAFTIVNQAFLRIFELNDDSSIKNVNDRDWSQWQVFDEQGTLLGVDEHPVRTATLTGRLVRDQLVAVKAPANPKIKWLLVSAEPIFDSQGHIYQLICTYHDITELRLVEEAVHRSQEIFYELIERSPFGTYVVDSQFRIAIMNTSSQTGAFCNVRPLIGRDFAQAMHVLWPDEVAEEIIGYFRNTLETGKPYYSRDFINPRHDAEIVEAYEWELHRIVLPNGHNGVICYYYDSTQLRQAEAAVRESEERLRLLGNNLPESAVYQYTHEADGTPRFLYFSAGIERLNGISVAEVMADAGVLLRQIVPQYFERLVAAEAECIKEMSDLDMEVPMRRPDGAVRWMRLHSRPRRIPGGGVVWDGVQSDITERKQAEEALKESKEHIKKSLAEKEVMLKEIHHRVKNNLQVISSLVSMQADNLTDERTREEFNDVCDRIRSMALIHEKLYQTDDLARLNFADYSTSLLHSLWSSHDVLAEKVQLTLAFVPVALSIETAVPCGLILNELAGNALKHAFPDGGGGEVTVGLEHDAVSDTACLWVRDNGIGLLPEMDWRQSSSLGLRLVQILAGQLHGTVKTGTGPGAEFRVTFPLKGFQS